MKRSTIIISLIVVSLIWVSQSYAKIDPKTIVGMWLFNEGSGDKVKDSSGNGNDGKITGAKWVMGSSAKLWNLAESLIMLIAAEIAIS